MIFIQLRLQTIEQATAVYTFAGFPPFLRRMR